MTSRRARVILVLVVLSVVGLGVFLWEPIYWLVITEKRLVSSNVYRGWKRVLRKFPLRRHGLEVEFWTETGFKRRASVWHEGRLQEGTLYNSDGTVWNQMRSTGFSNFEFKTTGPWWWGVTDQAFRPMPAWMKDDGKWQAALDAQD